MAITKVINDLIDLNATDATKSLKMPNGAAYSGTTEDGMIRNSSETGSQGSANVMQHFNSTDWKNYENLANTFTTDFLVVAGGGGGGPNHGGGGGAGGYLTTTTYSGSETPLAASLGTAYDVTVGPGGAGALTGVNGTSGSSSEFNGITPIGGGGGALNNGAGVAGGSGGGGSRGGGGGSATTGQGNAGAAGVSLAGGGGGGAGTAGFNGSGGIGGNGGAGIANLISGTSTSYAGGGGGNGYTASGGTGGSGGGGNGGQYGGAGEYIGTNGVLNTGGGGGGNYSDSGTFQLRGMNGGSGTVVLRYPTASVSSYAVTGTLDTVTNGNYPIANKACYTLNGNVLDISGNGYNGTNYNVNFSTGRYGQAGSFNGSSSYVDTGISGTTVAWGYSAWFKTSVASGAVLAQLNGSGSSSGVDILVQSGGQLRCLFHQNGSSISSTYLFGSGLNDGNWHHVAYTWDGVNGNNATITIDGTTYNQTAQISGGTNADATLKIGRMGSPAGGGHFNGLLDQVRAFSSKLSASQINSLYNEGTVVESTDGTDSILQFIGGTGTVTFS